MRFHHVLEDISGGRARSRVLEQLLRFPGKRWTGRQLALFAEVSQPQAGQALQVLSEYGLVESLPAGRARLWSINQKHYLFPLLGPIAKTDSSAPQYLADKVIGALSPSRIKRIILFGSFARSDERPTSDIDLFVEVADHSSRERARQKLLSLSVELSPVFGNPLMPVIYSSKQVRERRNTPLVRNLHKEGLLLYGEALE